MELQEYITETVVSVLKGISAADEKLKSQHLGEIWKHDFATLGSDLVGVRILKGKNPDDARLPSPPILVLDYDVNVIVEDRKKSGDSADLGVGGKVLSVFQFSGKVKGESEKELTERSIQKLKFSVPVVLPSSK